MLWFKGIEKVPASNAAVFTSMVPVSSIVLSAVVLKETVMGNIWLDWVYYWGDFDFLPAFYRKTRFFKFIGIDGYLLHISIIWNKIP